MNQRLFKISLNWQLKFFILLVENLKFVKFEIKYTTKLILINNN